MIKHSTRLKLEKLSRQTNIQYLNSDPIPRETPEFELPIECEMPVRGHAQRKSVKLEESDNISTRHETIPVSSALTRTKQDVNNQVFKPNGLKQGPIR